MQKSGQQAATEHAQNSTQNRKPNGQSVDEAAEILQDRRNSTDILLDIRHLTQVFPFDQKTGQCVRWMMFRSRSEEAKFLAWSENPDPESQRLHGA